MSGYMSETEETISVKQLGGAAARTHKKAKTVKQRIAAKARRDAQTILMMTDTLPNEVKSSGFHYDEESSREVLEESRELGNQSDDESEQVPIVKAHTISYKAVSSKRPGRKPKLQVRGLELTYDNTQSPFISATYLDNGKVVEGVLNKAVRQGNHVYSKSEKKKPRPQNRKRINHTKKRKLK
jgi:hypothetical protein